MGTLNSGFRACQHSGKVLLRGGLRELTSCNEKGQAPVEIEPLLLEVDRGALGGIDSGATAEFQLADRPQGLVDAAGCVASCFVADTGLVAALPLRLSARSKRKS
jgi:hypothetical protein